MPQRLKVYRIDEVSLVDRPANPAALLTIFKRADEPPEEDDAKTPERTHKMDMEPKMPGDILAESEAREQWYKLWSAFNQSIESISMYGEGTAQASLLRQAVDDFAEKARAVLSNVESLYEKVAVPLADLQRLAKAGRKISGSRMTRLREIMRMMQDIIADQEGDDKDMEKKDTNLETQVAELTKRAEAAEARATELGEQKDREQQHADARKAAEDRVKELEATIEKLTTPTDPADKRKAALAKMDPETRALFEEQETIQKQHEDRIAKAEAEAKRERDERKKHEAITKARGYKALPVNPDDHYSLFLKIDEGEALNEEERQVFYSLLKAAEELAAQGKVFTEVGKGGSREETGNAMARMQSLAKELVAKGDARTIQQAMDTVIQANPDLYKAYNEERS